MWPTVFDQHGTDRLAEWKKFRDKLETSNSPFNDVAEFWGQAPFVSNYLNPQKPETWPDPWHLILDAKLDDLAIALGMLYTIKLTTRFMETRCEIHTSLAEKEKNQRYVLLVEDKYVLNWSWSRVIYINDLENFQIRLLFSK